MLLQMQLQDVEDVLQMQLQDVADVPSLISEALWCDGEAQHTDQTVLKLCTVKLVDFRKIQGLNSKITSGEHLTGVPDKSSMFDADQETLQAQLKMSSVRLVDYRKAKAEGQPQDEAYDHEYNSSEFISSNKSSRFDGDQQTLHARLKIGLVKLVDCGKIESRKARAEGEPEDGAYDHEYNSDFISSIPDKSSRFDGDQKTLHAQLKMSLVKLVDCGKMQSRKARAEGEPEDGAYDHEYKNSDVTSSSKSSMFDGDHQTLQAQLKMSSVRLVDCRKIRNRKATAESEPEDYESKNNDRIPSSKTSRFDGDQQTLEAQLKVCLVKLVDCGKMQSRKATAEGEPEDGVYDHESSYSNFVSPSESSQSSSEDQEDGNTSQERMIKRKSPRKVKFVKNSYAVHLSRKHIALCKGQRVYRCSKRSSSSLDFGRHQNVHAEEKPYRCTQCGKEFSQRSQLRRHQRVHACETPYQCT
ncbi:hypothetical protein PDJAM_G00112120 [Pangasius djambal]|uniref:Uncharacterized protein n=1 Tax=Pangasius djambal TaxID=1691987 RepID=A0ACC5Y414_9TELE|nr:hypothetical protein [Pangasius djambal]